MVSINKDVNFSNIIRQIKKMVYSSRDARATALAELKEREGQDPFKILIGTILSHRTRDENTTKAVDRLFSRYRNAEDLADADPDEVKELIKTVGFYNVKAKNIILVARQIVNEFNGNVPNKLEDLLKLRSVGRKTANCVLVYGFGIPAIPVDTHVHRITNRLGLVNTKDPEETEQELMNIIPKKYWIEFNDLLVRFGQTICKPIKPRCDRCLLTYTCDYYREYVKPELKQISTRASQP